MSSAIPSLTDVARSKLSLATGGSSKDKNSLYRWVLLKNSLIRVQPTPAASSSTEVDVNLVYNTDAGVGDEEVFPEEHDSFMFPDAGKLVDRADSASMKDSEEQWFDSLLETLGDEDDSDTQVSLLHVEDDDDYPQFTPSSSPLSSSDDLINQPVYYDHHPVTMPYPAVYPSYHPPLIRSIELDSAHSSLDSSFPPFNVALPYYDADDIDDLSVPEAIEDVSDDESDALSTPSQTMSTNEDPAAVSPTRDRVPRSLSQVYTDMDDFIFYPFELDPLPLPHDHRTAHHMLNNVYRQEC